MSQDTAIEQHYGRPGLLKRMLRALARKGISENDLTFETLAPLDEFHVGGLDATRRILNRLTLFPKDQLVDLGCGTGGPARAMAAISGCHVSGFDLTREFIEAGTTLNPAWVSGSGIVQINTDGKSVATSSNGYRTAYLSQSRARYLNLSIGYTLKNASGRAGLVARNGSGGQSGIRVEAYRFNNATYVRLYENNIERLAVNVGPELAGNLGLRIRADEATVTHNGNDVQTVGINPGQGAIGMMVNQQAEIDLFSWKAANQF